MNGVLRLAFAAALAAAVSVASAAPSAAKRPPAAARTAARPAAAPSRPPVAHRRSPYVGAISADAATGRIIFQDRADAEAYPASVTKLMTALLVLEDVAAGRYALSDRVTATPEAYFSEASWVGIRAGQSMTVDDLLMALLVHSANDAAIVLGVRASGSLAAFVERMNARAAELGMSSTRYFNPNGLPPNRAKRYPWKEFNRTTAADQLKLALEICRHPEVFRYTSAKVATVTGGDGKPISMKNHNRILRMDKFHVYNPDGSEAVDGLKTGYIDAGGSSIVITGRRSGRRVIAVVLGSESSDLREEHAARILTDALNAVVW